MHPLERFFRAVRALNGDGDVNVYPMNEETLALGGHSENYQAMTAWTKRSSEDIISHAL